jgi:hypothetical protein
MAQVFRSIVTATACLMMAGIASAGSIFLTGHDPDFHALSGAPENPLGAQHINQTAIGFITDPAFNPFVATAPKFLFVESKGAIPGGHRQGKNGIVASGYVEGVDFDHHDFTTLSAALDMLGDPSGYSAIVVASDFGGILRQAELDILNARSADLIAFLNAGGGLYAISESNGGAGLTPSGGQFGFLPFIVTALNIHQSETGNTVTPFGLTLGLTDADVNGNFSHVVFTATGGLNVVDVDADGRVLSLATRSPVGPGGVVPESASFPLVGVGLVLIVLIRRRSVVLTPKLRR